MSEKPAADGKRLGKYIVGRTLGRGAFSKVKLGVDTTNKREVAIKIISKEQLQQANQGELLRREVFVMKTLDHPNIVKMLEVFQTANHIYLVLELVAGGDFLDLILAKKSLPEDEARYFFQQIVVAVHYCHSRGVAHRDLKPQNMLLDTDKPPRLRVSDFGLANLADQSVQGLMQSLCGTPDYVAPEVISEGGYDGLKADIWSLGVVLYIMFTCRPPFNHQSVPVMFERIKSGEYKMDVKIPAGAQDLIKKLIVVDPTKRATLDDVLSDPWFTVGFSSSQAEDAFLTTSGAGAGRKVEPSADQLASAVQDVLDDEAASPKKDVPVKEDDGTATAVQFRLGVPPADAIKIVESAFVTAKCVVKPKTRSDGSVILNGTSKKGYVTFSVTFESRQGGTAAAMRHTNGTISDFFELAAAVTALVNEATN